MSLVVRSLTATLGVTGTVESRVSKVSDMYASTNTFSLYPVLRTIGINTWNGGITLGDLGSGVPTDALPIGVAPSGVGLALTRAYTACPLSGSVPVNS